MTANDPMITADMLERQKLTQEGMAQFELLHGPAKNKGTLTMSDGQESPDTEFVVCRTCKTDFPCPRMTTMLIVQGLAMFQSMLPSGNMGAILGRFAGGRG